MALNQQYGPLATAKIAHSGLVGKEFHQVVVTGQDTARAVLAVVVVG